MSLQLDNINKNFFQEDTQTELKVLSNISVRVEDGQFISIIGPSGSGKSTLLRIISGLEQPSNGRILLKNNEMKTPYGQVGLIFQEYVLFPWRTVIDNVAFSLEIQKVPKKQRREKAHYYLKKFGLDGFENKFPKELIFLG